MSIGKTITMSFTPTYETVEIVMTHKINVPKKIDAAIFLRG